MMQKTIIVEGYYCISKEYPDISRAILNLELFKFSARKFNLKALHVTKIEKTIFEGFLQTVPLTGVVDTEGSLIPFFIDRQKAKKLQELKRLWKDDIILDL